MIRMTLPANKQKTSGAFAEAAVAVVSNSPPTYARVPRADQPGPGNKRDLRPSPKSSFDINVASNPLPQE